MARLMYHGIWTRSLLVCLAVAFTSQAAGGEEKVKFRDLAAKFFEDGNGTDLAKVIGFAMPVKQVIALEYKILLFTGEKEEVVDPKTHSFKVGDKIRLTIEPFSKSYIYIYHIGASGRHSFLLPREDRQPPCVAASQMVPLPSDGYFEFTKPAGDERLLVVATEKPVPDRAVLAKVLTQDPEQDNEKEKETRKWLNAAVEANLKSVQEREAELRDKVVKFRGGLADAQKRAELVKDVRARGVGSGTFEEPTPEGTFAAYISVRAGNQAKGRSNLLVTIPLKSR